MEILNYNDYQEEDSSFLLDALKVGVAAELMYIDNDAKVRFRTIDPLSCFGVYDNTLSGDLRYFVRIYQANEWDNSINYCVDVYDDKNVTHYNMAGKNGQLTLLS
jgi:SPP1 family phage portal protein|nr:MAG TPA: portal protein [Caudoviricetes sp.]